MINKIFRIDFKIDRKIATITIVSTLLLMIDYYHPITPWKGLDRTILYLIIPMGFILVFFKENPKDYGFCLGDWKTGLLITFGAIVVMSPILWFVGHGNGNMKLYYQDQLNGLPWSTFVDLFGWEFIFRGWLLFGYSRKFGPEAMWLQSVPFALAHLGKPEIETFSTIFGGFAFGWIAWKTKSFIYPFLIHWFIASFVILVASGAI